MNTQLTGVELKQEDAGGRGEEDAVQLPHSPIQAEIMHRSGFIWYLHLPNPSRANHKLLSLQKHPLISLTNATQPTNSAAGPN